ncbi:MAG: CsiV family protein [Thiogranum sp.]|nr:CsiV family protein [Thiogranum sp.]
MKYFQYNLLRMAGLLLLTVSFSASAADARQFDIELLIFRHLVNNDDGEAWPDPYADWPQEDFTDQQDSPGDPAVIWLPAAQYRLGPHQASLRSSAGYRPLVHMAWRQEVPDRRSATPLRLPVERLREGTAFIDGSATVAVERYLHLTLDLTLRADSIKPRDQSLFEEPEMYPLVETRRMRSGDIHYFDNPRFGVLALITPYKPAP